MLNRMEPWHKLTALCCGVLLLLLGALSLRAAERVPGSEAGSAQETISSQAAPAVVSLFAVGQKQQAARSWGTGFLISAAGILVTARHVCEAEQELFAFTGSNQKYRVTGFYGEDRDYDVALLKIEAESMPHLVLADARVPRTNQWVAVAAWRGFAKPLAKWNAWTPTEPARRMRRFGVTIPSSTCLRSPARAKMRALSVEQARSSQPGDDASITRQEPVAPGR